MLYNVKGRMTDVQDLTTLRYRKAGVSERRYSAQDV